jgi:integrase/recombinase XerD
VHLGYQHLQRPRRPFFRTSKGHGGKLAEFAMLQSGMWRKIRRRALLAGIKTEIGCHTFPATGNPSYIKHGGKREAAQHLAALKSSRTAGLYERRNDEISIAEVE